MQSDCTRVYRVTAYRVRDGKKSQAKQVLRKYTAYSLTVYRVTVYRRSVALVTEFPMYGMLVLRTKVRRRQDAQTRRDGPS